MNWLDADNNGNGILDGQELANIKTLGASALYALAVKIEQAQDAGAPRGNANEHWMGNFANLVTAVKSSSCDYLLQTSPFANFKPSPARETPVCIKDKYW